MNKLGWYCYPPSGGRGPKSLKNHLVDYNLIFLVKLQFDKSVDEFLQNRQSFVGRSWNRLATS